MIMKKMKLSQREWMDTSIAFPISAPAVKIVTACLNSALEFRQRKPTMFTNRLCHICSNINPFKKIILKRTLLFSRKLKHHKVLDTFP